MIIFNSVTKHFGPETQSALQDVSFEIQPGELVLITGPSGSGKTTLMKLITKEYLPSEGDIIFDEVPLSSVKSSQAYQIRRKIGVVFQDYRLLPELTVWENIALALSIIHTNEQEIEQRVTDLLDLTGLIDKAFLFPQQLSGGEAQRVSIARALSTAPKVIFADEPTGNLDEDTSQTIVQLLKKINELGTTILITTHDPAVRERLKGERNMRLEKGLLVEDSGSKVTKKTNVSPEESSDTEKTKEKEATESREKKTSEEITESKKTKKKPRIALPSFGKLFTRNNSRAEAKQKTDEEPPEKKVKKSTTAHDQTDDAVTVEVEEI